MTYHSALTAHDLIKLSGHPVAPLIETSARSAYSTVPHILSIFPETKSVIHVGCGAGEWLHHFQMNGVTDVLGIDEYELSEDVLQISKKKYKQNISIVNEDLKKKFGIAFCYGVAENLDNASTQKLIHNLTEYSDIVIFGSAIPGQNRIAKNEVNVNENWQSYWASFFQNLNYGCFDILRARIWYDARINWWYKQNLLVYVNNQRSDVISKIVKCDYYTKKIIDIVHPEYFEIYKQSLNSLSEESLDKALSRATQLESLKIRLREIEQSTSWKIALIFQKLFKPYPGVRKQIRSILRFLWNIKTRIFSSFKKS